MTLYLTADNVTVMHYHWECHDTAFINDSTLLWQCSLPLKCYGTAACYFLLWHYAFLHSQDCKYWPLTFLFLHIYLSWRQVHRIVCRWIHREIQCVCMCVCMCVCVCVCMCMCACMFVYFRDVETDTFTKKALGPFHRERERERARERKLERNVALT